MKNYYIVQRKVVTDPLYYLEPFTKWQAFHDMFRMANWDTGEIKDGQEIIKLKRGEFCHTENHLAAKWKWSRGKIRRFLKWCEKDNRITVRKTVQISGHPRIVVFVVNYNKHQLPLKDSSTSNRTSNGTPNGTETNNNNTNNNLNNNNDEKIYEKIIENLNELTGKKLKSSTDAYKKLINARIAEGYSVDDFLQVNKIKSEEWKRDPKFSKFLRPATLYCKKHFDTYLNSGFTKLSDDAFQSLYNSNLFEGSDMQKKYSDPVPRGFETERKLAKMDFDSIESAEALIKLWEEKYSESWRQDFKIKQMYDKKLAEFDD